jgi:hypothetical protein
MRSYETVGRRQGRGRRSRYQATPSEARQGLVRAVAKYKARKLVRRL